MANNPRVENILAVHNGTWTMITGTIAFDRIGGADNEAKKLTIKFGTGGVPALPNQYPGQFDVPISIGIKQLAFNSVEEIEGPIRIAALNESAKVTGNKIDVAFNLQVEGRNLLNTYRLSFHICVPEHWNQASELLKKDKL
jgi:hypothetical protein